MVAAIHETKSRRRRSDGGDSSKNPKRAHSSSPMPDSLQQHPHRSGRAPTSVQSVASDYREDEIIEALCQFLPPSTREQRFCVDIGARCDHDKNVKASVSHELLTKSHDYLPPERQQRWFGVLIQPDSKQYKALRQVHEHNSNKKTTTRCLQITPSWQEGLNERSLVWILRQLASQLPSDFDFLNVDGARCNNYWILHDFWECRTYHPRLVCIPYDSSFPKDVTYVPPRGDKYGMASLMALVELASWFRHQLVMTTKRCAFFVPNKLFQHHLRATIRGSNSLTENGEQAASQSREHVPSPDPRLSRQSTQTTEKVAETDTAAVISAGMQWLAERRKHLEQNDHRYRTKPVQFKKQVTAAWQKRKVTIIDTLQRQNAKRRHSIRERSTTPTQRIPHQKKAEDPPDGVEGTNNSVERSEQRECPIIDLTGRESGEPRELPVKHDGDKPSANKRSSRPDPPGEEGKSLDRQFRLVLSIDPDESREEDTLEEEADTIESTSINDSSPEKKAESCNTDGHAEKISQHFSDNFETFMNPYEESHQDSTKLDGLHDTCVSDLLRKIRDNYEEEEEIVFENKNDEDQIVFSDKYGESDNEEREEEMFDDIMSDPVVDMRSCFSDLRRNTEDRRQSSSSFVSMLRQYGCAWIRGTGVSRFACSDALMASQLLLQGADESTRRSCKGESAVLRGYSPLCSEQSGESLDVKDMVRKFRVGPESEGKNIWPCKGSLDENTAEYIQISFQNYHDQLCRVTGVLLGCIGEVMASEGVPFGSCEASVGSGSSLLSAWSCSRGSRHVAAKEIVYPFTEDNALSVLLVDGGDCAVFQHGAPDGSWESIYMPTPTPDDPVFLVYSGDSLQRLTDNSFQSIPRRLIPTEGYESTNALIFSASIQLGAALKLNAAQGSPVNPQRIFGFCDDDDDDTIEEEKRQAASLGNLATQLREADKAFKGYRGSEAAGSNIDEILEIATNMMRNMNRKEDQISRTPSPRMAVLKVKIESESDTSRIAQRCRSPSDGSEGLALPQLDHSGARYKPSLSYLNAQTQRLKERNPFRLARDKLLSKYTGNNSRIPTIEKNKADRQYGDSNSQKRSLHLAKLLPPRVDSRYPIGVSPPRRVDQEISGNEKSSRHAPFRGHDHPGSPGRPIRVDEEVLDVCAHDEVEPSRPVVASDINFSFSFSETPNAALLQHKDNTPFLGPLEKKFEERNNHNTISDYSRMENSRMTRSPTHVNAAISKHDDLYVREKRHHFLQLQSHLGATRSNTVRSEGVVFKDKRLVTLEKQRPVIPDSTQLPVDESRRTLSASPLHDSQHAQSMCSSMVETLEASELLEELLSADNSDEAAPTPRIGNIRVHEEREGCSAQAVPTNTLTNHTVESSDDGQRQGLEEYSTTMIKLQPSGHLTLKNSETMISKEATSPYLYNQSITFPQPTQKANHTGTPPKQRVENPSIIENQATKANITKNYKLAVSKATDSLDMGQYRHWKAERELQKSLSGEIKKKTGVVGSSSNHHHKATISGEVAGGSLSSVSELTDEGYKFGCAVPFSWPS